MSLIKNNFKLKVTCFLISFSTILCVPSDAQEQMTTFLEKEGTNFSQADFMFQFKDKCIMRMLVPGFGRQLWVLEDEKEPYLLLDNGLGDIVERSTNNYVITDSLFFFALSNRYLDRRTAIYQSDGTSEGTFPIAESDSLDDIDKLYYLKNKLYFSNGRYLYQVNIESGNIQVIHNFENAITEIKVTNDRIMVVGLSNGERKLYLSNKEGTEFINIHSGGYYYHQLEGDSEEIYFSTYSWSQDEYPLTLFKYVISSGQTIVLREFSDYLKYDFYDSEHTDDYYFFALGGIDNGLQIYFIEKSSDSLEIFNPNFLSEVSYCSKLEKTGQSIYFVGTESASQKSGLFSIDNELNFKRHGTFDGEFPSFTSYSEYFLPEIHISRENSIVVSNIRDSQNRYRALAFLKNDTLAHELPFETERSKRFSFLNNKILFNAQTSDNLEHEVILHEVGTDTYNISPEINDLPYGLIANSDLFQENDKSVVFVCPNQDQKFQYCILDKESDEVQFLTTNDTMGAFSSPWQKILFMDEELMIHNLKLGSGIVQTVKTDLDTGNSLEIFRDGNDDSFQTQFVYSIDGSIFLVVREFPGISIYKLSQDKAIKVNSFDVESYNFPQLLKSESSVILMFFRNLIHLDKDGSTVFQSTLENIREKAYLSENNLFFINRDSLLTYDLSENSILNITGDVYQILDIVNDQVIFTKTDSTHGVEFWKSDGSKINTSILKDIYPGPKSSNQIQRLFTAMNEGVLYFAANDGVHGYEVWKTDGSEEGTEILLDINDGPDSSYPLLYQGKNGILIKAVKDGIGQEQWYTNGSLEGTTFIGDLNPGLRGSGAAYCFTTPTHFYFYAISQDHGYQLFKYELSSSNVEEVKVNNHLLVYPNPANTFLQIESLEIDSQFDRITVFDINGRIVESYENPGNLIDISLLNAGTYIIEVEAHKKVYKQKFVKI